MTEENKSVTVDIYGTQYKLKGGEEASTAYIQRVAAEVDSRMRQLSNNFPRLDMPRIAVLTTVNVMDDCFKLMQELEKERLKQDVSERQRHKDRDQLQQKFEEEQTGLKQERDSLEADMQRLQEEKGQWEHRIELERKRNEELLQELDQMKTTVQQHKSEWEQQLRQQEDDHNEEIRKLRDELSQGSSLQEEYAKLQEEYAKLQTEYNEWIQLVEQDHPGK